MMSTEILVTLIYFVAFAAMSAMAFYWTRFLPIRSPVVRAALVGAVLSAAVVRMWWPEIRWDFLAVIVGTVVVSAFVTTRRRQRL